METVLLDSAHGRFGEKRYCLEQWWMVDDDYVVHITIQHVENPDLKLYSTAMLVCITGDSIDSAQEGPIRLQAFPSQWWRSIVANGHEEEPPEALTEVAQGLLARFVALCERAG